MTEQEYEPHPPLEMVMTPDPDNLTISQQLDKWVEDYQNTTIHLQILDLQLDRARIKIRQALRELEKKNESRRIDREAERDARE